jgi:hypothetical protein
MAPTWRHSTVAGSFNGSSTRTITKPTGTVSGDLLVATFFAGNGFWNNVNLLTPPTGWTTLHEFLHTSGNPGKILGIYYKVAGGSEPASYDWSVNDGANSILTMTAIEAGTFDATTPIGTTQGIDFSREVNASSSTSVSAPTVTPAVNDSLGIMVPCHTGVAGSVSYTPPAGWTERVDGGNTHCRGSVNTLALTTSATGTITATASSSIAAGFGAGFLIVVRPAAGGATDLVVADLTVTVVADAPTLTQTHELVVSDLTVTVAADAPTLTQTHVLTVADATVATTIDTVTLTQDHSLVVSDLTVAATIESPTLTVDSIVLVVADLTVAATIESPTLTVDSIVLVVADLTVAVTIESVTLTQVHELVVSDLTVAVVADTVTLIVGAIAAVLTRTITARDASTIDGRDPRTLTGRDVTPITARDK